MAMIQELFMDYGNSNMQNKILRDIIGYKANWIFAYTVIDILVKQNPDYRDDPNAKCQMDGFLADRETAFEGYYRLKKLYESEYGEMSDTSKEVIKVVAEEYANIPLVKFGWVKEGDE